MYLTSIVVQHYLSSIELYNKTTTHSFSNVFYKGADMDVCLTNYGHCNYISGKHACIFYDEVWDFKLDFIYCVTILHLCLLNTETLLLSLDMA